MKIKNWEKFNESFEDNDNLSRKIWYVWERHFGWVYDEDEEWMDKIKKTIEKDSSNLRIDLSYLVDVNGGPIGEEGYHIFIERLEDELGFLEEDENLSDCCESDLEDGICSNCGFSAGKLSDIN